MNKLLLTSIDGLRPDVLPLCRDGYLLSLCGRGAYNLSHQSVMPTITLPCHITMFNSVDPSVHGTFNNVFNPCRPSDTLTGVVRKSGGKCAMFYDWEELRDITAPGDLDKAVYERYNIADKSGSSIPKLTDAAVNCICSGEADFIFAYYVSVDDAGHNYGWMSKEYIDAADSIQEPVKRLTETALEHGMTVIITSDHGGHNMGHGADIPEDMNIPLFILGSGITAGELKNTCITDIAPTAARLMSVLPDPRWTGKALI